MPRHIFLIIKMMEGMKRESGLSAQATFLFPEYLIIQSLMLLCKETTIMLNCQNGLTGYGMRQKILIQH